MTHLGILPGKPRRGWMTDYRLEGIDTNQNYDLLESVRSRGSSSGYVWLAGITVLEAWSPARTRSKDGSTRSLAMCRGRCSPPRATRRGLAGASWGGSHQSSRIARCALKSSGPETSSFTCLVHTGSTGTAPSHGWRQGLAALAAEWPYLLSDYCK